MVLMSTLTKYMRGLRFQEPLNSQAVTVVSRDQGAKGSTDTRLLYLGRSSQMVAGGSGLM